MLSESLGDCLAMSSKSGDCGKAVDSSLLIQQGGVEDTRTV